MKYEITQIIGYGDYKKKVNNEVCEEVLRKLIIYNGLSRTFIRHQIGMKELLVENKVITERFKEPWIEILKYRQQPFQRYGYVRIKIGGSRTILEFKVKITEE